MKSKKTESPSSGKKKVKDLNKLNKQTSHPLIEKLIQLGFDLLRTRL